MMKLRSARAALLLGVCAAVPAFSQTRAKPLKPKVVIVAYFEVGKDTGDWPGEAQSWVERDHLDRVIEVPGMTHAVRANANGSEIAVVVGPGAIRPAANLTVLGMSPKFDLRESYWLIQGIAGVSPKDMAIGSAVWTNYVINGDLVHFIDPREMPKSWPDGFFALGETKPETTKKVESGSPDDVASWLGSEARMDSRGTVIRMNQKLLRWAYDLTKDTALGQTPEMQQLGARFTDMPAATAKPDVEIGANLTTGSFWGGALMDAWAHRWVAYQTQNKAKFGSTAENDSGAMVALQALTQAGRANWNWALLLRTGSNYDRQPPSMTAAESMASEKRHAFTGYKPALDAAYAVGHRVVVAIESGDAPRP